MDIIDLALPFGTPAYLGLQIASVFIARREGWRIAFLAPLLFSVPIAAWCFFALMQESNLWPLPFVFFAPLGAAYLMIVLILRALVPMSSARE